MSYVYQKKAVDRIKKGLVRLSHLVAKGAEAKYQEADTRKIVEELLAVLGWDKYRPYGAAFKDCSKTKA